MRWLFQTSVVSLVVWGALLASSPGLSTAHAQVDPNHAETPIDLTKAKRGSCKSDAVESDRGCVQFPKLTKRVPPEYPQRARRSHESGTVSLSVTLSREGKVVDVSISGSLPKNQGFEDASITAVRQWQYSPALLAGEPVSVVFAVRVDFSVSG